MKQKLENAFEQKLDPREGVYPATCSNTPPIFAKNCTKVCFAKKKTVHALNGVVARKSSPTGASDERTKEKRKK